ncbi:MAG: GAF domain-containing SpoIIE family protein phosphatase [Verrucomicrobiota bacterium]
MPEPYLIPFLAGCLAAILLQGLTIILLRNQRRKNKRLRSRFVAMESEEERMFHFLHDLGHAIESDPSPTMLSRIIVEGIDKVVSARGGAIYFLGSDPAFLVPSYISDDCPPLVGIPMEVRRRAERDPRALESHLRLARVPADEGIFGHCISAGAAIHVPDVKNHPAFHDPFSHYGENVSVLLAPIRHAGKDLGVLAVARLHSDGAFTANDFEVFRSAGEQSSFAIGNARIHREANEKRAIETEIKNAAEVQRILLPQSEPVIPGFRISGVNIPARIISGDYYDYIPLENNRFGVVIADVSGKGVAAGLLMAMCRSSLQSVARTRQSPTDALTAVNRQLFPDIREDMFISAAYGILDGKTGGIILCRAGHEPTLWYHHETRTVEFLRPPGLAIGVDGGSVFERVTKDLEIVMKPGDCLLFHTDGVREAEDAGGNQFGLDRLAENFRRNARLGSETVLRLLQEELRAYTGDGIQMDDITLVAVEKR